MLVARSVDQSRAAAALLILTPDRTVQLALDSDVLIRHSAIDMVAEVRPFDALSQDTLLQLAISMVARGWREEAAALIGAAGLAEDMPLLGAELICIARHGLVAQQVRHTYAR